MAQAVVVEVVGIEAVEVGIEVGEVGIAVEVVGIGVEVAGTAAEEVGNKRAVVDFEEVLEGGIAGVEADVALEEKPEQVWGIELPCFFGEELVVP